MPGRALAEPSNSRWLAGGETHRRISAQSQRRWSACPFNGRSSTHINPFFTSLTLGVGMSVCTAPFIPQGEHCTVSEHKPAQHLYEAAASVPWRAFFPNASIPDFFISVPGQDDPSSRPQNMSFISVGTYAQS